MPSKIILSYRRSDSDVITGRIRDNLANRYGEDAVFMDIDSIPLGFDYREQMRDALSDNKGNRSKMAWWQGKDARINANNDPVRIELETAFQQGMRIIPVLVSGATMPKAADLPQSLRRISAAKTGIADRTAAHSRGPSGSSRKWIPFVLGASVCLAVTAAGILTYRSISPALK